ncbi:hypothetical protein ACFP81_04940 [Deinococcus lacus]|uniref:Uncharacterized protein n=1 Tax=Deinococcus lacus TaxID=392561 RepID=A0ABW1YAS6_9DEIO
MTTQTLRLGDLQIRLDAPQWVSRQSFYPLGVTYTNLGTQPLGMADPFDCGLVWRVVDEATGQVPRPKRQTNYACTMDGKAPITLAPGETHSGTVGGIIDRFPRGHYRLGAETWQVVAGQYWRGLKPTPQEIRFEIR